jgi:hypothetical protein
VADDPQAVLFEVDIIPCRRQRLVDPRTGVEEED